MHGFYGTYGKDETTKSLVLDIDPRDTIRLAETESLLWDEAQISLTQGTIQTRLPGETIVLVITCRWCFTDRSWKNQDNYLGQGWYNTLEGFDGFMEARNSRASQSPLHSEIKSLIWEMECMRNLSNIRLHLQQIVLS